MTFEERVAVLAHIGWGIALTLLFGLWLHISIAAGLTLLIAAGKESIESIWGGWEPRQPWSSAVYDVSEFGIGIVLAMIAFVIRIY